MAEVREALVLLGLGSPSARGFVAASVVGVAAFLTKYPADAFREDGSMKPWSYLSTEPDATSKHFLLLPAAAAVTVALFT